MVIFFIFFSIKSPLLCLKESFHIKFVEEKAHYCKSLLTMFSYYTSKMYSFSPPFLWSSSQSLCQAYCQILNGADELLCKVSTVNVPYLKERAWFKHSYYSRLIMYFVSWNPQFYKVTVFLIFLSFNFFKWYKMVILLEVQLDWNQQQLAISLCI